MITLEQSLDFVAAILKLLFFQTFAGIFQPVSGEALILSSTFIASHESQKRLSYV